MYNNLTNLTINKLDKSDKPSNMLQVHCNQFPWGLLYLLFVLFFCLVCGCLLKKKIGMTILSEQKCPS